MAKRLRLARIGVALGKSLWIAAPHATHAYDRAEHAFRTRRAISRTRPSR